MKVELKSVKTCKWASDETTCFNAVIFIDGIRAGTVENDGHGGCNFYFFTDRKVEEAFKAFAKAETGADFEPEDVYIGKLLDQYETEKQFRRWCKTKTVFRLKGDKPEQWRTLKSPYSPASVQFVRSKYGDQVEEILNERFAA